MPVRETIRSVSKYPLTAKNIWQLMARYGLPETFLRRALKSHSGLWRSELIGYKGECFRIYSPSRLLGGSVKLHDKYWDLLIKMWVNEDGKRQRKTKAA
jgi:hypothetical protein